MACDLKQLGPQLLCRDQAGAAGNHQRAAGKGSPPIGRAVGIAMYDSDLRRLYSNLIGDDLGQRRSQPLPVRRRPDPRLHQA